MTRSVLSVKTCHLRRSMSVSPCGLASNDCYRTIDQSLLTDYAMSYKQVRWMLFLFLSWVHVPRCHVMYA